MNTYCLKNSNAGSSLFWPDGKCEVSLMGCDMTNKEMVPHKTPGLMELGTHAGVKLSEIRAVKREHSIYGVGQSFTGGETKEVENQELMVKINDLYEDTCQKRGRYPTAGEPNKIFNQNEYDFNQSKCILTDDTTQDLGTLCGALSKGSETGFHTIHWPTYTDTDTNVVEYPSFTDGICISKDNTAASITTCGG